MKAERVTTRYGEILLLYIQDSTFKLFKLFMPNRYPETFTNDDLNAINTEEVKLNLIYKGMCVKTKWNILAIE